ncbi:MAG: hypothetical protein IPO81_31055 [Kouleothrix sp.]|nr:hypothetical protein [Kouleothrix sp.]
MNASLARRRVLRWTAVLLLLLLPATIVPAAGAQGDVRYFGETGHFLRGAFRSFWESRGGLSNFGFPVTEEFIRKSDGRIVQYFERARFELTVQGGQAIIQLGLLGRDVSGNKIFPRVPPFRSSTTRRYFAETQHSLTGAFKATWDSRGGLPIFGFPISEEINEPLADGSWHLVQYFERVRFELWPGGVLLGLLGREVAPPQLLDRWPPEVVPPGPLSEDGQPRPPAAPPSPPGDRRASVRVSPNAGLAGQAFTVAGDGFAAGERVLLWVTAPDQSIRPVSTVPAADGNGSISGAGIKIGTDKGKAFPDGFWYVTGQGLSTGRIGIGVFQLGVAPAPPPPPPPPPNAGARLGTMIHQLLTPRGPGSITPLAAPPGLAFTFAASGYDANERVGVWLTRPNGAGLEEVDPRRVVPDGRGNISVVFTPSVQNEGIWTITGQGVATGRAVTVPFKVTRDYVAPLGTPRPASRNGAVQPTEGGRSTIFNLSGTGFRASEVLELWITSPDGIYYLTSSRADSRGRIGYSPGLLVQFGPQNPTGVYGYHYHGTQSNRQVDLYFTYNGR